MHEFFQGWRRKLGCITLLMACVLMVLFFRSFNLIDGLSENLDDERAVESSAGRLVWSRTRRVYLGDRIPICGGVGHGWTWHTTKQPQSRLDDQNREVDLHQWLGVRFEERRSIESSAAFYTLSTRESVWSVPHWMIILPVTLLSAWLLVSKPHRRPQPNPGP